jgi:thymidylate synthase (FAD)
MSVKLISITKPEIEGVDTAEDLISYCARVSNPCHRSFSFQEFSQRYSTATELEDIEWRMQGKTNRQVGDEVIELSLELQDKMFQAQHLSLKIYDELIGFGIAKECARMVLPLNTTTTIYMNGTIRSWIHYLEIRCKDDTQKKHREIANMIRSIFTKHFPTIAKALQEN